MVAALVPRQVHARVMVAEPAEETPLALETRGLDADALQQALELRMQHRSVSRWETGDEPRVYVLVEYAPPTLRITVIQPNGDAYDRTLERVDEQPLRTAAVTLATLLDAVGTGAVAPSRTQVPQPQGQPPSTVPEPPPSAEPEPEPESESEPEPLPAEEHVPEPVLEVQPEAPPRPRARRLDVGVSLGPTATLGLFPSENAFAGGGVSLGLLLATQAGAVFGTEGRFLGLSSGPFRLYRTRFSALAGYRYRKRVFDLLAAGRVFVEPWWLRRGRHATALQHEGTAVTRRPLFGGGLRVSPGMSFGDTEDVEVRVGATFDLDVGVVPHESGRSVVLSQAGPNGTTPFARLGGAELSLGLDATVWF